MAQMELVENSLPVYDGGFDAVEAMVRPQDPAERDDSSLCFLCLRWTTDDPGCRHGVRCELQRAIDSLPVY